MRVLNSTIYAGNPYHGLLYSGIPEERYTPFGGSVDDALAQQAAQPGGRALLHIHWEDITWVRGELFRLPRRLPGPVS